MYKGKTQTEQVLVYMEEFGSITPLEAMRDLGILRLSARIKELRDRGEVIETKRELARNRWGRNVSFARYVRISRK